MDLAAQENEVEVWGFATGNMPLQRKKIRELVVLFKSLPGFIAASPHYPRGTLLVFETENDAKVARNRLEDQISPLGKEIVSFFISKEEYEGVKK